MRSTKRENRSIYNLNKCFNIKDVWRLFLCFLIVWRFNFKQFQRGRKFFQQFNIMFSVLPKRIFSRKHFKENGSALFYVGTVTLVITILHWITQFMNTNVSVMTFQLQETYQPSLLMIVHDSALRTCLQSYDSRDLKRWLMFCRHSRFFLMSYFCFLVTPHINR